MTTSSCLPDLANLARFPSTVTLSGVSIRSRLNEVRRWSRRPRPPCVRSARRCAAGRRRGCRSARRRTRRCRPGGSTGRRCPRSPRTRRASAASGRRHGHQAGDRPVTRTADSAAAARRTTSFTRRGLQRTGARTSRVDGRAPPDAKPVAATGLDPPPSCADGCGPRGRCQRGDVRCPSRSPARPVPARPLTSGAPTPMSSDTRPTRSTSPELDPRFVFDFRPADDPGDGQRFSTWLGVEPLSRGPEPRPDWVVTSQAAVDTELGVLKTGKEADVFLRRAGRPRRPRPAGRDGRQALPRRGAPLLPPQHRLHRGPAHPEHPRRPGAGQEVRARPGRRRRASGPGRSGRPSSASGRPASRSPTRCRSTAPRS